MAQITQISFAFRDVKALQPEGRHRAGSPHGHPEAQHHHGVPPRVSGLSDQRHWQGEANRGQAAAEFMFCCVYTWGRLVAVP